MENSAKEKYFGDIGLTTRIKMFTDYTIMKSENIIISNEIMKFRNNHIYESYQFIDAPVDLQKEKYNEWYKMMSNHFFYTVQVKRVINSEDWWRLFKNHSPNEVDLKGFSGYSIHTISKTLSYIDPYLMALLIFKDVKIENINGLEFVTGIYTKNDGTLVKFGANFLENTLYTVRDDNSLREFINMYDFFFTHFKKPIFYMLNSVNEAIDYHLCPNEGIGDYTYDKEICSNIRDITGTKTYRKIKHSKVRKFIR